MLLITLFVIVVLVVAAFMLRPLWRWSPASTVGLAAAVILLACGLYAWLGTPSSINTSATSAPKSLPEAIEQLEAAVQRDGSGVENWRLLGRAYAATRQYSRSRDAYARAAYLSPDEPDVLVDAAKASALADPKRHFNAASTALLQHALDVKPQHQRARWFMGVTQFQSGKPAEAASTWEPLLAQVDAKTAKSLRMQINFARRRAGLAPLSAASPDTRARVVHVEVRLDPELASHSPSSAVVFVIARVPNGALMPIAVERHSAKDTLFTATLDDGDGPMPTQRLSSQQTVEVIARLSPAGTAMPQASDIESPPVIVQLPSQTTVHLTIGAKAHEAD